MRLFCTCLLVTLLHISICFAKKDGAVRIVLVGNAGEAIKKNNGFLQLVRSTIPFDSATTLVYLGNATMHAGDTATLRAEAALINGTGAKAYFVPGYNEWARGNSEGYRAAQQQQRFIASLDNPNIRLCPADGCPGPKKADAGNDVAMVFMNTQWWLHTHEKPGVESACGYRSAEEVFTEMESVVKDKARNLVLFIGYHSLYSAGSHAGNYSLRQHVFPLTDVRGLENCYLPLPVIGSLYPVIANALPSRQHLLNYDFKTMAQTGAGTIPGIRNALKDHPHTIFISGQEPGQQLTTDGRHFYINSNAGYARRSRHGRETHFVGNATGFTVLEISKQKTVTAHFYEVHSGKAQLAYSELIEDYAQLPALADTATLPLVAGDTTVTEANKTYQLANTFKRHLDGENYRREWAAPVAMSTFHLATRNGGMEITSTGGYHESKSLHLQDTAGGKWSLRAVNKNMEKVIPEGFRHTIVSDIVNDMATGEDPYGALMVPGLSAPLGIPHYRSEMVFIPNDTDLGYYRPLFANNVAQLEDRKMPGYKGKMMDTYEAIASILDNGTPVADQATFLKARLVDFLVSDFDRHRGQWDWLTIDSGDKKILLPLPKDRDNAFYDNDGWLTAIARHSGYGFMTNFFGDVASMKDVGVVGLHMDMYFLNQLSAAQWQQGLNEFKAGLTDAAIDSAVHALPPEIFAIDGARTIATLRKRRDELYERGMDYYRFISRQVNVTGTNLADSFVVTGVDSGLLVQLYTHTTAGHTLLRYTRVFDPKVTDDVRLYGFGGNDHFYVDRSVNSSIKLRIVGGTGKDTFDIRGNAKTHLYDLSYEDNYVAAAHHTTVMFSADPSVNDFIFRETIRNSLQLPAISFGLDEDGGFLGGIGVARKTFAFRKYPFASYQRIDAFRSFRNNANTFRYSGEFIDIYRHYDLLAHASLLDPPLRYFYGLGNATRREYLQDHYRTRYDIATAEVLFRKRLLHAHTFSIAAGPIASYYWVDNDKKRSGVMDDPAALGLTAQNLYEAKQYAGGKMQLTYDNLNSEWYPRQGVRWITEGTALQPLNKYAAALTKLTSTLDVFAPLTKEARVIAELHLGGGHIFSNRYEYFQALTIGGDTYMYGFRRDRFAGASMAYGNATLRLKLLRFNAYVVKGDLGILGFNDVGRVWVPGETSATWHHGYGGGLYLVPFDALMITGLIGWSEEDRIVSASLGAKVNVVFR